MAMQVSSNGNSIQTASGPQILLQDKWPLAKLDTTKDTSFQTISILFNREPHQPDPVTFTSDTVVYFFPHGYTYTPRVWMEWQNKAPSYPAAPGAGGHATTFYDFGDDSANENLLGGSTSLALYAKTQYNADPTYGTASATAFFYVRADDTNVYIHLAKASSAGVGIPAPVFIVGTTADMRVYTFVEKANILPNAGATMQNVLYKFSAYSTINTALTAGVPTKVQLNAVDFDTSSNFDTTNYQFIVPVTGDYHISAQVGVTLSGLSSTATAVGYVYKNGSPLIYSAGQAGSGSATTIPVFSMSELVHLEKDDYVELYGYCSEGGRNLNATHGVTFLSAYFVST